MSDYCAIKNLIKGRGQVSGPFCETEIGWAWHLVLTPENFASAPAGLYAVISDGSAQRQFELFSSLKDSGFGCAQGYPQPICRFF